MVYVRVLCCDAKVVRYAFRLWLHGASAAALMSSYADVALELKLPVSQAGQEHKAVWRWMAQHRPCLVVVDNVDHVKNEVVPLLPRVGHVVMTSRDRRWPRAFSVVEMVCFTEAESLELLGEDSAAARQLAARVDYLPVALSVAYHAIEAERRDVATFGIPQ